MTSAYVQEEKFSHHGARGLDSNKLSASVSGGETSYESKNSSSYRMSRATTTHTIHQIATGRLQNAAPYRKLLGWYTREE